MTFRLETVLKDRERKEKLRQKVFAEQLQSVQKVQTQLDEHQARLNESIEAINHAKSVSGFTVVQLQLHENYRAQLKKQIQSIQKQLQHATLELNKRRQNMIHAAQRRRTLEILKEHAQQKIEERQKEVQAMELDEFAQIHHLKQMQQNTIS